MPGPFDPAQNGPVRRVVILEDERPARIRLEAAIRRAAEVDIAAALGSVAAALDWFATNPEPDLVFADVQLADGLCLEIFDRLDLGCPVIFCTAYDEYLVEALASVGIDYLLKPIRDGDVAGALAKYERLEAHFADRGRGQAVARALASRQRLLVRDGDRFVALPVAEIAYFVVAGGGLEVVATGGARYSLERTLTDLESELDAGAFFRINRQVLARDSAIRAFQPYFKGRLLVELEPATEGEVIVSQENAARFRAWLDR